MLDVPPILPGVMVSRVYGGIQTCETVSCTSVSFLAR